MAATTRLPIDRDRLRPAPLAAMQPQVHAVGPYAALTVDGFYADVAYVRELALALDYTADGSLYPGKRASISIDPLAIVTTISRLIGEALRLDLLYRDRLTFSMMTHGRREVRRTQNMPHFDPGMALAALVYLNPPEQCRGGTAFYRHRASGLHAMPGGNDALAGGPMKRLGVRSREELSRAIMQVPKALRRGFITGSNEWWELTRVIEMRCNRLVIYPGALFHSEHVDVGWFGLRRHERRLTQTMFLEPAAVARHGAVWSAGDRLQLVKRAIRFGVSDDVMAHEHGLDVSAMREWRKTFLEAGWKALEALETRDRAGAISARIPLRQRRTARSRQR